MNSLIKGKEISDAVQAHCKHRESEKREAFSRISVEVNARMFLLHK